VGEAWDSGGEERVSRDEGRVVQNKLSIVVRKDLWRGEVIKKRCERGCRHLKKNAKKLL